MSGAKGGAKKKQSDNAELTLAADYVEAKIQVKLWEERAKELRAQLVRAGPRDIQIGLCVVKIVRRTHEWISQRLAQSVLSKRDYDSCCVRRETDFVIVRRAETIRGIEKSPRSLPHGEINLEDVFGHPTEEGGLGLFKDL